MTAEPLVWPSHGWSELHRVMLSGWGDKWPDVPSVYRLVMLEDENAPSMKPASIPRWFGPDETGTLYLGMAKSLYGRLGALVNAVHPDQRGGKHHLHILRDEEPYRTKVPAAKLAIAWLAAGSKKPDALEDELVKAYVMRFGEAPPLNRAGGINK